MCSRGMNIPHGSEQRTIALFLKCLDCLLRQRGASLLECLEAGIEVHEGEFETCRFGKGLEDAAAGGDNFAANAIAGN